MGVLGARIIILIEATVYFTPDVVSVDNIKLQLQSHFSRIKRPSRDKTVGGAVAGVAGRTHCVHSLTQVTLLPAEACGTPPPAALARPGVT